MNKFLELIILLFINEHHCDGKYLFWTDLTSTHYFYETQKWMYLKVKYAAKHLYPPNMPHARPIKNFWNCLAQNVYERGWEAKTDKKLRWHNRSKLKENDQKFVESLMKGVKAKVKSIGEKCVNSLFKKIIVLK